MEQSREAPLKKLGPFTADAGVEATVSDFEKSRFDAKVSVR
jgi:hypothetical protein